MSELLSFLDLQTAALRWLRTIARVVVVVPKPDGVPGPLWDLEQKHAWEQFDYDTWILTTPDGPLLWARNGDDANYKKAFLKFAKAHGLETWDGDEYHVDHLLSRKSHSRPYGGDVGSHLHVLALVPRGHNMAWSAFERRNHRHNNVFDLWLVVKAIGGAPPLKKDGLARWLEHTSEVAPQLVTALDLKPIAPGQVSGPNTGPGFLAEALLGHRISDGASAEQWVRATLLEEILENAYGGYPWRFEEQEAARKAADGLTKLVEEAAHLQGPAAPSVFFEPLLDVDLETETVRGFVVEPIVGYADLT